MITLDKDHVVVTENIFLNVDIYKIQMTRNKFNS